MSLSSWFWKENIRECFSCILHLPRRGQLHHCDQKIAFFFGLEKRKGTNFLFSFTLNRYSLKLKGKKQ